jgi:hypothetical protein
MGHPDGAHTHGGGGFDPMPILIIIGAIAVAGPVAAAAVELLHILLIAVAVIGGLAAVGLAAVIAFRVHRWRAGGTTRVSLPAPPPRGPSRRPGSSGPRSSSTCIITGTASRRRPSRVTVSTCICTWAA